MFRRFVYFIRYVDMEEFKIKEEFLGFIELSSTSGSVTKKIIIKQIEYCHLRFKEPLWLGYGGGSKMSDRNNGVQAFILED